MSEYWKSNPRKFCDFCKCWIADNKPSVDFHERGKRHKENVQIRLAEMAKKGKEEYEAQQQEGDFLRAMEEAALKAYKNDIEQNPDMTGSKISEIASSKNAEIVVATKKPTEEKKPKEAIPVKKWYEAKSPEGSCYYWNIETGASKWEEPEEGFLSLAEQEKLKKKDKKSKSTESQSKEKKENNSTSLSAPPVVYGPAQKAEAYSTWEKVIKDPEPEVDYQLPQIDNDEYYSPEISFKKPEVSFKEKTVTLSANDKGGGQPVAFKKRKAAQDSKKSMRQRTNDL
ncbi:WW domain-binding protein 4-like [Macrobrachium nipponense]|uniref:WW domain-binding protein 4-like n=1 Tax=Macrobrachium nipponense TaxID=159736 RepID=UPI0030C85B8B